MGREGPLATVRANQASDTGKPRYQPPSRKRGNELATTAR
jgi:hypothetical protein